MFNSQVFKAQYQHGGKLKFLNKELVEVEEHTKCKCDCKTKASDCNQFQRYEKAQCLCKCINTEDKNKCLAVRIVFFLPLKGSVAMINNNIFLCLHRKIVTKCGTRTPVRVDAVRAKSVPQELTGIQTLAHAKR